jgi:hypothetical protein
MIEQPASNPERRLAPGEVVPMPLSVFIPEKSEKRKRFFGRRRSTAKTGGPEHRQAPPAAARR